MRISFRSIKNQKMAVSAIDCYSLFFGSCLSIMMMTGCKKEQPNVPNLNPPPAQYLGDYNVKVTTMPVTGITGISAFTGSIVIDKSVPALIDFNYIELNTRSDFDYQGSILSLWPYDVKGDSFYYFIEGLHPKTTYYIRALSDDKITGYRNLLEYVGTTYGDTLSFTTDSLYLGMMVNGGIVFYIDSTGEHGLISSLSDLADLAWVIQDPFRVADASSTTDGLANTMNIVYWYPNASPATSCSSFIIPGWKNSWFLPAKDQLEKMYLEKDLIGGFSNKTYWSSTEADLDNAYAQDFSNGSQSAVKMTLTYGVRPIRQF
jgi:hypothetical protein